MTKIPDLELLDGNDMDGSETFPIVKGAQTKRATIAGMNEAAVAQLVALFPPMIDRSAATSGSLGMTFLLPDETCVGAAVIVGNRLASGIDVDTGEVFQGNIAFDDIRPLRFDGDGVLPLLSDQTGATPLFLKDGQAWAPSAPDTPEVVIRPVNGIAQAFLLDDGGTAARQATFSQIDVVSARVDGPGQLRFAAEDIAGPVTIQTAPFLHTPRGAATRWAHIVGMGQSLSVGYNATASQVIVTVNAAAPDDVLMFNGGVIPLQVSPTGGNKTVALDAAEISSLVGAREEQHGGSNWESHLSTMGWAAAGPSGFNFEYPLTVSGHGFGGTAYADMKKGQQSFANMLAAVQAHNDLAAAAATSAWVPWLDWVHGEADAGATLAAYLGYLDELCADANADIPAITGQGEPVLMVTNQIGSNSGGAVSQVALAALQFGTSNPLGVCAGPKYMLPFSDAQHLESAFYRVMGEYHAKFAMERLRGHAAFPLHLTGFTRVDARTLKLKFHVPVAPIAIGGLGIVTDPGDCGISVEQVGAQDIASVEVTGRDEITVRMVADLTAASVTVAIAMQNLGEQGPQTGPRSIIHDSDNRTGPVTGTRLVNWCCHCRVSD
jgi:hypothetical protein